MAHISLSGRKYLAEGGRGRVPQPTLNRHVCSIRVRIRPKHLVWNTNPFEPKGQPCQLSVLPRRFGFLALAAYGVVMTSRRLIASLCARTRTLPASQTQPSKLSQSEGPPLQPCKPPLPFNSYNDHLDEMLSCHNSRTPETVSEDFSCARSLERGIIGSAIGMLGKVWSSGALAVVQNVAIIPGSVHPQDKLEGTATALSSTSYSAPSAFAS